MRKWCPEPFDSNPVGRTPVFAPSRPGGAVSITAADSGEHLFQADPDLTAKRSLWDLLNTAEKEEALAEAKAGLRREFQDRERVLAARHQAELAEAKAAVRANLASWSREFTRTLEQENREMAANAAALALAMAGRIIRDTVAVDPLFVERTLETALYKVRDSAPVTVTLHPEDAERMRDDPQLMKRLRIGTIVPDRRIDRGGCRVQAGKREWDATISGQLKVLEEVLGEALAAAGDGQTANPGGADDSILE